MAVQPDLGFSSLARTAAACEQDDKAVRGGGILRKRGRIGELLEASTTRPMEGGASFTRRNRAYRVAWLLTWTVLASWTPPQLRAWRRFLLRLFGAKLSVTANVYASARIWSPRNLEMGAYAAIGPRADIYSMAPIVIGSYAVISQGAHLCAGTHDVDDPNFQLRARPIVIGARAWIATEAFVGPGVTVGEGAVLGARGCAMRSLEPWGIYSGNPAALLRDRRMQPAGLAE